MKDDLISRQEAVDAILHNQELYSNNFGNDPIDRYTIAIIDNDAQTIAQLPSAQPERVWHPVEKPPAHHKDVIVRGVEAIGNVTVHKVMQWDVDTWRPTDYAPSIMWTEWSEI